MAAVTQTGTPYSTFSETANHTTNTVSVTVPSGSKYLAIIIQAGRGGGTAMGALTSVTVNGSSTGVNAVIDSGSLGTSDKHRKWGYELVNPTAGTYNVVVTFSHGCNSSYVTCQCYDNVDTTSPSAAAYSSGFTTASAGTKSLAPTVTPTVSGDYLIGGFMSGGSADTSNTIDNELGVGYYANNGWEFVHADDAITGSGETLDFTNNQYQTWSGIVWIIKQASVGATDYPLDAASGSYSVTGSNTGFDTATNAETGAYTLIGVTATFDIGIHSASGSYALTGSDAGLTGDLFLSANAASYTITGVDAGFIADYSTNAEAVSYVINGFEVIFYSINSYELDAASGSYVVTGADTSLLTDYIINSESGGYSLTGVAAAVVAGYSINAELGAYTITGIDVGLLADYSMPANSGGYTLSGFDTSLVSDGDATSSGDYYIYMRRRFRR